LFKKNVLATLLNAVGLILAVPCDGVLGDRLLVRYNHFGSYDPEKRTTGRIKTANPSWWQKAVKAFDVLLEPEKK